MAQLFPVQLATAFGECDVRSCGDGMTGRAHSFAAGRCVLEPHSFGSPELRVRSTETQKLIDDRMRCIFVQGGLLVNLSTPQLGFQVDMYR